MNIPGVHRIPTTVLTVFDNKILSTAVNTTSK